MEETLRTHLIVLADAFHAATGMSRQSIGKAALRDNTFFKRLNDGDGFTVKTYDKLVKWFAAAWPAGTIWPPEIERPVLSAEESAA